MGGKTGGTWAMGLGAMEVEAARRREVFLSDAGWAETGLRRTVAVERFSLGRLVSRVVGRRTDRTGHRQGVRPAGRRATEA